MSGWNANCWSSAARSLLWWSVLRGCNDATSASNDSKNFVVPSVRVLSLDTDNPRWRGSRNLRVQSCSWSDVSYTLVASTRVATKDLLSDERRVRELTGEMINTNHFEPRRFLEDAGNVVLEWVRDAVEKHGSVKVNIAFNGETHSWWRINC